VKRRKEHINIQDDEDSIVADINGHSQDQDGMQRDTKLFARISKKVDFNTEPPKAKKQREIVEDEPEEKKQAVAEPETEEGEEDLTGGYEDTNEGEEQLPMETETQANEEGENNKLLFDMVMQDLDVSSKKPPMEEYNDEEALPEDVMPPKNLVKPKKKSVNNISTGSISDYNASVAPPSAQKKKTKKGAKPPPDPENTSMEDAENGTIDGATGEEEGQESSVNKEKKKSSKPKYRKGLWTGQCTSNIRRACQLKARECRRMGQTFNPYSDKSQQEIGDMIFHLLCIFHHYIPPDMKRWLPTMDENANPDAPDTFRKSPMFIDAARLVYDVIARRPESDLPHHEKADADDADPGF